MFLGRHVGLSHLNENIQCSEHHKHILFTSIVLGGGRGFYSLKLSAWLDTTRTELNYVGPIFFCLSVICGGCYRNFSFFKVSFFRLVLVNHP